MIQNIEHDAMVASDELDSRWNDGVRSDHRAHYKNGVRDGFKRGHAAATQDREAATLHGCDAKRCANGHLPVYMHQEMQCPACWARERADECNAEIAALLERVAAAEARAAEWVKAAPSADLAKMGWYTVDSSYVDDVPLWLMVPPVPLPGEA